MENDSQKKRPSLSSFFQVKERGSNLKTEIVSGFVVFLTVLYVLPLTSELFGDIGMDKGGVFLATGLLAGLTTLLMALVCNRPAVLMTGMAMSAFLANSLSKVMGFSWMQVMLMLSAAGFLYFLASITPFRMHLIQALPQGLKCAVQAGLGAYLLFVGLKKAGLAVVNSAQGLTLGSLTNPAVLVALFGILVALAFSASHKKKLASFAASIGVIASAAVGLISAEILMACGQKDLVINSKLPLMPFQAGVSWEKGGLSQVVFFGLFSSSSSTSFSELFSSVFTNVKCYLVIFSIFIINIFETTPTFLTVGRAAGFVDEESGEIIGGRRCFLPDAVSGLLAGFLGTSTTTCFAESNIGVSMGAKTGLTALTAGLLCLAVSFLYPLFYIFSYGCVVAPAIVLVGLHIMKNGFSHFDFSDYASSIGGLFITLGMVLTGSLADGMGLGLIAYVLMMLLAGRRKEISLWLYGLSGLFAVYFALMAFLLK